ncbi:hypothetical protein OHA45_07095 [Streptomyces lydicus]|uniref:hypothetical protein n=1 Tax=Streptomyces lydicus TaxID=47763 RepID=UPI002E31C276|nr:hypothetical protein [Streptomyces lydicus]
MTDYDVYGTHTHTTSELARLLTGHLGLAFTERDSDYRGVYQVAYDARGRIEVQPNALPRDAGDQDDQDDLWWPEHPNVQVLLEITTPHRDPTLHRRLGSLTGLVHLHHEAW